MGRGASVPAAVVIVLLSATASGAGRGIIEGYAWPPSVRQGGTVSLCVSTDAASFDLEVLRQGWMPTSYLTVTGIPGLVQAVPDSAWQGCGWVSSYDLAIPPGWPSGVYHARLSAGAHVSYAAFTVVEDDPGSTARILFQNSIATWHAYDPWGGKCLYDVLSSDGKRAYVVSFQRPYSRYQGRGLFPMWEQSIVRWLEREGYAVEYCTDLDTHADPSLQSNYDLFLVAGHDEYWSNEMRDNIEARIASGGNVAFFGGNTCWWQIRYSPDLTRIICYKNKDLDPLYGVIDSLVTIHWHDDPVNRPGNHMTGASLSAGGNPTGNGGYTVVRDNHWVFEGTGLASGMEFGTEAAVVGVEVDGALFQWQGGFPVPTGEDGTPLNFQILAMAPATFGWATLGVFEQGGTVFNAATINWAEGIRLDPVTRRVSENVFSNLVAGNAFWGGADDVVLEHVSWSDEGEGVRFCLRFRNTSLSAPSRGIHGALHAHALGHFGNPVGPLGAFDLGSIDPGGADTATMWVPDVALPPSAPLHLPGGIPTLPGCPGGSFWAGGASVVWRVTGVSQTSADHLGRAILDVCPAAGTSHVGVTIDCPDSAGTTWTLAAPSPGWTADLLADDAGSPGSPAPNPLPPGPFPGWIAVSAETTVPSWDECTIELRLVCTQDSARILVLATACDCRDPTGAPPPYVSASFRLAAPSPNPFRERTVLRYELSGAGRARMRVYDVSGRLVRTLVDGWQASGPHAIAWDGLDGDARPAAPGLYFCRLESAGEAAVEKTVRLP